MLLDVGRGVGGQRCGLLGEVVEAAYVGGVMFGVMELHDLARDGGFESGVVIYSYGGERLISEEGSPK